MSLHIHLLRIFASTKNDTDGINSMYKRFYALAIICINLAILAGITIYEILYGLGYDFIEIHLVTQVCLVGIIVSLYLLKLSYVEASAAFILGYLHLASFCCSAYKGAPLASLAITFLYPVCGACVTESERVRNFNILVTIVQFAHDVNQTHKILQENLSEDQLTMLNLTYITILVGVFSIFFSDLCRKEMEKSLVEIAQANYDRSLQLTKEVFQVVEARDIFISSILREIKNPLKTISEAAQNLSRARRGNSEARTIDGIHTSVQTLLNMSNNMNEAANIKSGKLLLSLSEVNVTDLVKKIMRLNLGMIIEKKLDIKAEIDENVPNIIHTDGSKLHELLANLMSNALKFISDAGIIRIKVGWTPPNLNSSAALSLIGNPYNEISEIKSKSPSNIPNLKLRSTERRRLGSDTLNEVVTSEFTGESKERHIQNIRGMRLSITDPPTESMKNNRNLESGADVEQELVSSIVQRTFIKGYKRTLDHRNGNLKIQITDSGIGMSQEAVYKLFNTPSSGLQSSDDNNGGLGLGLYVCKGICSKMDGDIAVDSKTGMGTTFVFYLPIQSYGTSSEDSQAQQNQFRKTVKVLVVDDQAYNRDLLKLLLEREGAFVVTASSGAEAVRLMKEKEDGYFTVILMDIEMPGMNGIDAVKAIGKWEDENNRTESSIYFVTGGYYDDDEVKSKLKSQGVPNAERIGFIKKPLDVDVLRRILKEFN